MQLGAGAGGAQILTVTGAHRAEMWSFWGPQAGFLAPGSQRLWRPFAVSVFGLLLDTATPGKALGLSQ